MRLLLELPSYKKSYVVVIKTFRKKLIHPFEKDYLKTEMLKIKSSIDWRSQITFLKKSFKLKILTKELDCNYKILWQWQKGSRVPNLERCLRLQNFCERNNITIHKISSI